MLSAVPAVAPTTADASSGATMRRSERTSPDLRHKCRGGRRDGGASHGHLEGGLRRSAGRLTARREMRSAVPCLCGPCSRTVCVVVSAVVPAVLVLAFASDVDGYRGSLARHSGGCRPICPPPGGGLQVG